MSICIGEVNAVQGVKILVKANDISTHDVLFNDGEKYEGISIKGYLLIRRGFREIVCKVEGEYLEVSKLEKNEGTKETHPKYLRKVELKPVGYFEKGEFNEGIKYLPRIKDKVYLASESKISDVINSKKTRLVSNILIGKTINEDIPVLLPWQRLFNTHIGIFGNTGSGKSNTLTKLYTELFNYKNDRFEGKSKFILIDFNGEYTQNQILPSPKKNVINLNTHNDNGDKIHLEPDQFWNSETLSLLFKATDNTQKPFINRLVRGKQIFDKNDNSLKQYLISTFTRVFTSTSQKKEVAGLFIEIMDDLNATEIADKLRQLSWHSQAGLFHFNNSDYFNGGENEFSFNKHFKPLLEHLELPKLGFFLELKLRINLQLINDLQNGYAQFEHIQPLLKRADAFMTSIERVIEVNEYEETVSKEQPLQIISLRNCNQDIKKIIPLLIAKQLYETHKLQIDGQTRPKKTLHLIIDEAHNILSSQSIREQESWKDYRLELFEEIIKEGRKFGVFLTLSSQRPSDISPTIMSQLHNYFIHRLVNDKDLALLDSTVNTLDRLSKDIIPHLGKGCCILTGTTFDMPLLIQVDKLSSDKQPDSEDIDLESLWDKST